MQVENPQELAVALQFKYKWNEDQQQHVEDPKHPQFILAVDADYFSPISFSSNGVVVRNVENFKDGINAYPAVQWLKEVKSYLFIGRREMLDNQINYDENGQTYTGNRNFRQILPYCAICSILENGEKLYFPYFRTNKVGESKLANKVSIGYGGHIDAPDVIYLPNGDIDLFNTVIGNSVREILTEETRIYNKSGVQVSETEVRFEFANQFITQNTDPEILHLGVIMNMILPLGYKLTAGEDELEVMEPMTARQLLDSEYTLEPWTRAMLEADVADRKTKLSDALDVAGKLAESLKDQVQANSNFLEEEAKVAEAITTSTEPLKLALGVEEITDPEERANFLNCASDVTAEALFQVFLGNVDSTTMDMSVDPPVLKPFVPLISMNVKRNLDGTADTTDKTRTVSITDDKGRTIFLTPEEEKALEVSWRQKFAVLKGEDGTKAPVDDGGHVDPDVNLTPLLDGQEMSNASFNEMITGDPGQVPTPEEVEAYLKANPQDEVKQPRGMNGAIFHIDDLSYKPESIALETDTPKAE